MCMLISGQLTVYFDCPFWVGVFEVCENNTLRTARVIFGSEPKDGEVYELVLRKYYQLHFSEPLTIDENYKKPKAVNPKRLQRQIHKSMEKQGIGTKAQQAISRQRELNKIEKKNHIKTKARRGTRI